MPPQNLVYLFAAYSIIMVVLIGYMLFLSQQIGDLRNQLTALRRQRSEGNSAQATHGNRG
ncbi:MAG TPA: CcmD family protein [Chloroflexota bacterium]|nr:CcmD family protein [Chloroflexota bacterium]